MPARKPEAHAPPDRSLRLPPRADHRRVVRAGVHVSAPLDPMASPEIVDNRATDAEFAVRAFYDGVKHFFATGDAAGIREVVAENFVDQVRLPVADSGREGFVRHLGAVRRAFPGLQIEPAEIAGHGDTVAVRLEVAAGTAAPFLGMPVTGVRPWGSVELFRVVAGQIVARWAEPGGSACSSRSPPNSSPDWTWRMRARL